MGSQYLMIENSTKVQHNGHIYYPLSFFKRRFPATFIAHKISEFFDTTIGKKMRGEPMVIQGDPTGDTGRQLELMGCPCNDILFLCDDVEKNAAIAVERWLVECMKVIRGHATSRAAQRKHEQARIDRAREEEARLAAEEENNRKAEEEAKRKAEEEANNPVKLLQATRELLAAANDAINKERAERTELQTKVNSLAAANHNLAENVAELTRQMSAMISMWQ